MLYLLGAYFVGIFTMIGERHTLLRMMRGYGPRQYELNERLQTELVDRADREQRPVDLLPAVARGLYFIRPVLGYKQLVLSRKPNLATRIRNNPPNIPPP
jgi:hypothetical protein